MSYQIFWTNKNTGVGKFNPKLFEHLAEVQSLADELNQDYPDYEHVVVVAGQLPPPQPPAKTEVKARTFFAQLQDNDLFPFGIHADAKHTMVQVPSSFYDWLRGQPWLESKWPNVAEYIVRNQAAIDQDMERTMWR